MVDTLKYNIWTYPLEESYSNDYCISEWQKIFYFTKSLSHWKPLCTSSILRGSLYFKWVMNDHSLRLNWKAAVLGRWVSSKTKSVDSWWNKTFFRRIVHGSQVKRSKAVCDGFKFSFGTLICLWIDIIDSNVPGSVCDTLQKLWMNNFGQKFFTKI